MWIYAEFDVATLRHAMSIEPEHLSEAGDSREHWTPDFDRLVWSGVKKVFA